MMKTFSTFIVFAQAQLIEIGSWDQYVEVRDLCGVTNEYPHQWILVGSTTKASFTVPVGGEFCFSFRSEELLEDVRAILDISSFAGQNIFATAYTPADTVI